MFFYLINRSAQDLFATVELFFLTTITLLTLTAPSVPKLLVEIKLISVFIFTILCDATKGFNQGLYDPHKTFKSYRVSGIGAVNVNTLAVSFM